ncbi:hypothetical protein SAMN02745121_00533 [Nannocystis exedens]|uniref:Uncharacterized protein n=1 Tax=Nannocystis exedens TaxID=54 RepID=A0A1I1T7B6_9BACT|nr:hypothetical protein [Nannocystis exedens]PCC66736.1 hypothetical protein NAEX_09330 [Nannocystis exedens]SFD54495.1 hypothetical protein SAMN02745121_00533 [Nannocystis exedens]
MGSYEHDDDDRPGVAARFAKGSLLVLGGLFALMIAAKMVFSLFFAVLGNVLFVGALAGAGYIGYRLVAGSGERKAVTGGRSARALGPGRKRREGDDFERKMRELEAIERQLDAEISKR